MQRGVVLATLLLGALALPAAHAQQCQGNTCNNSPDRVPGEVLIQFKSDLSTAAKVNALARVGLSKVETVSVRADKELILARAAQGIEKADARSVLAELKEDVEFAGEGAERSGHPL